MFQYSHEAVAIITHGVTRRMSDSLLRRVLDYDDAATDQQRQEKLTIFLSELAELAYHAAPTVRQLARDTARHGVGTSDIWHLLALALSDYLTDELELPSEDWIMGRAHAVANALSTHQQA